MLRRERIYFGETFNADLESVTLHICEITCFMGAALEYKAWDEHHNEERFFIMSQDAFEKKFEALEDL